MSQEDNSGCMARIRNFLGRDKVRARFSLISLTLQNAAVVLVTRYSRSRPGDLYFSTTAVVMSELVKLLTCLLLVFIEENYVFSSFLNNLKENILRDPWDCVLVSVPGVIYTLQNNLLFVGYSNLDAVSFQISYQLKIFTTAIFFRILLGRQLSRIQWISLFILFTGVCMTQINDIANPTTTTTTSASQSLSLGLASVVLACTCSGFAGVFFEKLLKGSNKSVAVRNIQLAFYGVTAGIVTAFLKDGSGIVDKGFFFGYDGVVWAAILIQSLGGLLIAATIRYADNILKGFATSIAIVLTFILSIFFFDFHPSFLFYVGGFAVIAATMLYSSSPPPKLVTTKASKNNTDEENV